MKHNFIITLIAGAVVLSAACCTKSKIPGSAAQQTQITAQEEITLELPEETNPLFTAISEGDLYQIKILIDKTNLQTKNYEGKNALHLAAEVDNLAIVKLLIGKGMDVNAHDNNSGATALHSAAANGNLEMVDFLVRYGANVNAVDTDGYTPLDNTETNEIMNLKITKFLIENGAVIKQADSDYSIEN